MESLIEARGIDKSFRGRGGPVEVLRGCDFTLERGESVAIIGPSGSGKSTLLNVISGLDRPTRGAVSHLGTTVSAPGRPRPRIPFALIATVLVYLALCLTLVQGVARWWLLLAMPVAYWLLRLLGLFLLYVVNLLVDPDRAVTRWRNRTLGFVFQFHFLLPDFTALENLLIPARMAGADFDEAEAERRARDLLSEMGLDHRLDHLPGELSGGEQQRVAVARAFMNRPQIVLADEPFGNLDVERGRELTELLFELQRREGTALVIVTHDLELADRTDRVLRLHDGRLVPADLTEGAVES